MKDPFNKLYKVIMQDTGDFNYQDELVIFEREIGEWEPIDGWQWSDGGLDENQNGFEETFLSYNGKVQVYLKEDGSIDVIDPDKNHKLFKRGAYKNAKAYITKIFRTLDKIDRMKELDCWDRVRRGK